MPQHANLKPLLVVLQCLLFTTTVTTNTVRVVRRIRNNQTDRDAFSNPSCNSNDCPANSACFVSCCMCHCAYDYPNFLARRWECWNTLSIKVYLHSRCAFSIRPENRPIEVLLTTEVDKGKVKFTSSNVRINCSGDVMVSQWDYLNAHDQWVPARENVFSVSHRTVGGPSQDKKDLTFLKWNSRLHPKYSGLLIRIWLYCKSNRIGCFLAKLNGTYTYDTTSTTVTSPISTTPGSTTPNTGSPTRKEDPTTESKRNTAGEQVLVTHKYEKQSSTAAGPILGIVGGVIALLCLIILLVIVYRKRRSCLSCITKNKAQSEPVVNYEPNYQDSIYAEVADIGPDFDNPVYTDPAAGNLNRRSKQDPLPGIPGNESSYQPLNELTRTIAPTESESPSPPSLPPISYPLGDGLPDNEASDDYVGPGTPAQPESEDYDNPTTTQVNYSRKESSNYDNPTLDSITESSNYDNPLQAVPPIKYEQGTGGSSSINADTEGGPEYFELEPDHNGI